MFGLGLAGLAVVPAAGKLDSDLVEVLVGNLVQVRGVELELVVVGLGELRLDAVVEVLVLEQVHGLDPE
eukprot:9947663-Prorocentrum_lima.AAC.1